MSDPIKVKTVEEAAKNADWQQVVLNGQPALPPSGDYRLPGPSPWLPPAPGPIGSDAIPLPAPPREDKVKANRF